MEMVELTQFEVIALPGIVGVLAMLIVAYLAWSISRESAGTPRMIKIASYIQEGANTFLKRQYKTILLLVALLAAPTGVLFGLQTALTFILGAILSLVAAYIGMNLAVRANVRTTNAARISSAKALTLSFRGGAVMGLSVVGLSLLGVSGLYYLFQDPKLIVGFGFGASLAALFAQLGGGIYTKAADIGADLVGKIEAGIPEDDPRNPAVIADQVGDNVGDCAGRGSDLFESMSDDYITAMILGAIILSAKGLNAVMLPLMMGAFGIVGSIVGVFIVRGWQNVKPVTSFNVGLIAQGIVCAVGSYISAMWLLNDVTMFYAALSGIVASLLVGLIVQYYTGIDGKPVRKIAEASERGAAINILTGISYALQSPILPLFTLLVVILFSYIITGGSIYGIAVANIGGDLIIGFITSADTFGPITDNANGIAEMSGVSEETGEALELLDAMGNTTKAYTKAYATASATLSAVCIIATFSQIVGLGAIDVLNPFILVGLLVGVALPFLFSSMAIGATGKTAFKMVDEVRRQFREIPGLLEGKAEPDYAQCIDISTKNSLREMILPTFLTLVSPIVIGTVLGKWALGAFLIGATGSVALLSPLFTYGGGAWDNAKKYIEVGRVSGKGTPAHAAAVVGDTVGDPMKDVAGPSLNIFMKLTNMTALLIAPILFLV